jgi:hypothetical protein
MPIRSSSEILKVFGQDVEIILESRRPKMRRMTTKPGFGHWCLGLLNTPYGESHTNRCKNNDKKIGYYFNSEISNREVCLPTFRLSLPMLTWGLLRFIVQPQSVTGVDILSISSIKLQDASRKTARKGQDSAPYCRASQLLIGY